MAANYKQVLKHLNAKPNDVQEYFKLFDRLISFPWEVSVTYVFSRVEAAKHQTLYCGIVKLHWTDSDLTRHLLDREHMTRGRFRELFKITFGKPIDTKILQKLSLAEKVRDRIAHGKDSSQPDIRDALIGVFDFADEFNAFVDGIAGFRPFGKLQGFKGRKQSLPRETTRWVLKGMGIPGSTSGDDIS
jgi:hypothetical protein